MIVYFHRTFKKQYARLRDGERRRFQERFKLFMQNPSHPILRNHSLQGKYKGCYSIAIGGDLRVVYELVDAYSVLFTDINTHDKLYS